MNGPRARTFFEKVWNEHVIADLGDGAHLLQIDRLLLHDVTGGVIMRELRTAGRAPHSPKQVFGIIDHLLATQTLIETRPKTMRVSFDGALTRGVSAKDMILALIVRIGAGGGSGYAVEFSGAAARSRNERSLTSSSQPARGWLRSPSTSPTSAPAPTRACRTCALRQNSCAAGKSPPRSARSACPDRAASSGRRRWKASIRCSRARASNGTIPAAACAAAAALGFRISA